MGSYFPDQGSNLGHLSWELGALATLRTSKDISCTPFLFWEWSFNQGRHSLTRFCLLSFLCGGILASCLALVNLDVLVWFSSFPSILRVSPIHPMWILFHKISRGQFYLHLINNLSSFLLWLCISLQQDYKPVESKTHDLFIFLSCRWSRRDVMLTKCCIKCNQSSNIFNIFLVKEILGGPRVHLGFSLTSYGTPKTNFLANPMLFYTYMNMLLSLSPIKPS